MFFKGDISTNVKSPNYTLQPRIFILLRRCLFDSDDEVNFCHILQGISKLNVLYEIIQFATLEVCKL